MSRSFLYTSREGAPDGAPFLVFHDRYLLLQDAEALAKVIDDDAIRIAVQSPRAQSAGGSGITKGYFWYIGPLNKPELSTLGDGLYQLELLIDETFERYGQRKIGLYGTGEGGVIAMLAGLIFPDKVSAVVAIDAPFPTNIDQMPLEVRALDGLPVLLSGEHAASAHDALTQRGALVTTAETAPQPQAIADFLRQ